MPGELSEARRSSRPDLRPKAGECESLPREAAVVEQLDEQPTPAISELGRGWA